MSVKKLFNNLHSELIKHDIMKEFRFEGKIKHDNKNSEIPIILISMGLIDICEVWVENTMMIIQSSQMYYDDPRILSKIDLQDPNVSIVDKLMELIIFYNHNCVQEIRLNDECRQAYLDLE